MTASVYTFPAQRRQPPPLDPERRKLLLDDLAVRVTSGYEAVGDDVIDANLDAHASPDLTQEQRGEFWDDVLTWIDLREGFHARRILPDAIGCWDHEDAEKTAEANAQDALSLLVFGNQTAARGSHSPRGNASA